MKTRVKICGVTTVGDAMLAADLGAYAVGFVFYPGSKRYLPVERARDICRRLPPFVVKVGVFVNETWERMTEAKDYCGLDRIQVHGEYGPFDGRDLSGVLITSYRIGSQEDIERARRAEGFPLLDSLREGEFGGTGERFRWDLLKDFGRPFILAGGINLENIDEALRYGPYAVDIASGVEKSPGVKDPDKMRRIFLELRG